MLEAAADRRSKRHSDSQYFRLAAGLKFQRKRPGASPSTRRIAVGHYGIEDEGRPPGESDSEGSSMILESVITCPECGTASKEQMPTDACLFFHQCVACGARLKPKAGDCCVFCSYGTVPCPPIQSRRGCCA